MGADCREGGAVNLWPGLLSLDLAAKYCSMKPVEFKKAVAAMRARYVDEARFVVSIVERLSA